MAKKSLKIGTEIFTLEKGVYIPDTRAWDIFGAYTFPSKAKMEIWEHWKKWFYDNKTGEHDYISIGGYNTHMFSVVGRITIDNIEYSYRITPSYNRLYLA